MAMGRGFSRNETSARAGERGGSGMQVGWSLPPEIQARRQRARRPSTPAAPSLDGGGRPEALAKEE